MSGIHGDPIDRTGRHRGERKPLAIQVALKGFLDRVCGKSPHKDWSGHPLDDEPPASLQCPDPECGASTYEVGYGCRSCGAIRSTDEAALRQWEMHVADSRYAGDYFPADRP